MRPRCLRISVVIASDRYTEGHKFNSCRGPGWKGYSIYPWVGRCGLSPCTLTLFETKIADFPTLFKTEFRFLIPCLRHLTRDHTLCKTIINIETLYYLIHLQSQNYLQLDQQSRSLVRRTYARAVYRPRKDTLFKIKIDKIDTLINFEDKKMIKSIPCTLLRQKSCRKTYPGWPHVPIKAL